MAGNNGNANVPANVVLLPAINDSREDWSILVRVIRMWRVLDYATNRIHSQLRQGNRIHATVKKQFIYKFEKDLDEDSVYYMSKFGVVPNVGEYRTTRHAFKLDFQLVTKLRKVSNDSVPVRNYLFTPPAYCFQPDFEREYLVDIIGVLTGVGTSHEYTRNGVKSKLINKMISSYRKREYVSPCEAVWRIFAFDIHHKWPPVQRLTFHLPNNQTVYFDDNENIEQVVFRSEILDTMFLAWFKANRRYTEGKGLTYSEFPTMFVYEKQYRSWHLRKRGQSIGRLHYVPPGVGELYYMRIMLTVQKGCVDYEDLRTVNGITYKTFQEACYAMGLLDDDREFIDAITEASELASGNQLRKLFVTLLIMSTMNKPEFVWDSTWRLLSDGIVYDTRRHLEIPDLHIRDEELKNLCLTELEKLLRSNGRSLADFSMPFPNLSDCFGYQNKLIVDELRYDKDEMVRTHKSLMERLTTEQKKAYEEIMNAVMSGEGGFFFLDGYGGTGKTYCWNTLSAGGRSQGFIVLNVASSGIASLLLPGGCTAHSTFSIPLAIRDDSTCCINQGSPRAQLLIHTKLIIWDEAPMMNMHCFEALDRTLRDIMSTQDPRNLEKPFGGKVIVLGGDLRQILPVIRK